MFRRKKTGTSKQPSAPPVSNPNPDYKPPMSSQQNDCCPECRQDYDMLIELRDVQNSIKRLEKCKEDLKHLYFPNLYWVIAAIFKVADRLPGYLFDRTDELVDRGSIESGLSCLAAYLDEKNINQSSFDVDEFCFEVKAYINNTKEITIIQNRLDNLYKKQTQIKESLDIE